MQVSGILLLRRTWVCCLGSASASSSPFSALMEHLTVPGTLKKPTAGPSPLELEGNPWRGVGSVTEICSCKRGDYTLRANERPGPSSPENTCMRYLHMMGCSPPQPQVTPSSPHQSDKTRQTHRPHSLGGTVT